MKYAPRFDYPRINGGKRSTPRSKGPSLAMQREPFTGVAVARGRKDSKTYGFWKPHREFKPLVAK